MDVFLASGVSNSNRVIFVNLGPILADTAHLCVRCVACCLGGIIFLPRALVCALLADFTSQQLDIPANGVCVILIVWKCVFAFID